MQNLKDINDSKDFYNDRYAKGYMEEWPADKKSRVYEVIESLNLPNEGDALDFGCGNGVFTVILKKVLPNWNIYGCDVSEIAIKNTAEKNVDCTFFVNSDTAYKNKKFDFIFSHHVLEHVFDISEAAKQIVDRTNNDSSMLHIFPCGNRNSFEWQLCSLRADGINKEMENRFFFEDKGHVRRMTTDSCVLLFKGFGFILKKEFYSGQYYGAINWITMSHPVLIFTMFNPVKGRNLKAKFKLSILLIKFILISALRLPYVVYGDLKNMLLKILFFTPLYISKCVDKYIICQSDHEWQRCKTQRNGSEMYLYFTRNK